MKVIVKNIATVFNEFLKIERAVIQYEKFDGTMTDDVIRLNMNRGNSVAALLFDPYKKSVIMIRQFRYPAFSNNKKEGWLLEIVAGVVENGHDPKKTIIKEIYEEVGYEVHNVDHILTFYTSPGGSSEKVFLYFAEIHEELKIADGGGLDSETEDIQIVEIPLKDALNLLDSNVIIDAKTIIALQWLKNNRNLNK